MRRIFNVFCLQLDVEKIVMAQNMDQNIIDVYPLRWMPVVDGEDGFLPREPLDMIEQGEFHQVPIMIGYNKVFYLSLMHVS